MNTPPTEISAQAAQAALNDIALHFAPTLNGRGKMAYYEILANKLSAAVQKSPPWGPKYIQSALTGSVIRTPLRQAIMILAASLDGLPVEITRAQRVEIYAEPHTIRAGSYVFGQSHPCAWPGCPTPIVRDHWNRRYCRHHQNPANRQEKTTHQE